jgi:hypothetical protein
MGEKITNAARAPFSYNATSNSAHVGWQRNQANWVLSRYLAFLKGLADPHTEGVTIQALSDVCTKIDVVLRA